MSVQLATSRYVCPYDRCTDEATTVQNFYQSYFVAEALRATFQSVVFQPEELDGHARSTTPTPPRAKHCSPSSDRGLLQAEFDHPLEPLFGLEENAVHTPTFGNSWIGVPPSPSFCPCGSDRSACPLHPRTFSRTPRISDTDFPLPEIESEDIDPFMCTLPEPGVSGPQEKAEFQAFSAKSRMSAFALLDLPEIQVDSMDRVDQGQDLQVINNGPPPGLASPRRPSRD